MTDKALDVFGDNPDNDNLFPEVEVFETETSEDSTFNKDESSDLLDPAGKIHKRYLRMDVFKVEISAELIQEQPSGFAMVHYVPTLVLEYQDKGQDGMVPFIDKIKLGEPQKIKLPFRYFSERAAREYHKVSMQQIDQWFTELLESTSQMTKVPLSKQILALGGMAAKFAQKAEGK